jgi:hypothetical protein
MRSCERHIPALDPSGMFGSTGAKTDDRTDRFPSHDAIRNAEGSARSQRFESSAWRKPPQ